MSLEILCPNSKAHPEPHWGFVGAGFYSRGDMDAIFCSVCGRMITGAELGSSKVITISHEEKAA